LQAQQLIVQQTKTDLLNLLNLNPDSTISINDTIVTTKNILLVDVMNGIEQNPQIISLDQQVKISELIEKETASLRAPSLRTNLGLNYGRNQATGGQLLLNQTYTICKYWNYHSYL
jgi:hypothetical protein